MSSSSADALVLLPLVVPSVLLILDVSAAMALFILVAVLGVGLLIRRLPGKGP